MDRIQADRFGWLQTSDELMLEVGAVGELLVAKIRLAVACLVFLMPILAYLSGSNWHEVVVGGTAASSAVIVGWLLLRIVRLGARTVWIRFLSTAFDVTAISLVLLAFLLQDFPHTAVNSRVVWPLYLLAIAATALRGDQRVCLFGGALSIIQYSAIVIAAASLGDLNSPRFAPFPYGYFSWGDQVSRLILLGAASVIAMASIAQTRRLLVLSSIDRTTGVRNRAYLDYRLRRELDAAAARGRRISIAMVDVDHFKAFNDRHGHLAGDQALKLIAGWLRQVAPASGFVARYGGEEFVVVMPGIERQAAAARMKDLCRRLAETPLALDGGSVPVTISVGIGANDTASTPERLLDEADRKLLGAKQSGRNRVVS